MIWQCTITVTISWGLSKLTRTWYITFAYIKPISRSFPIWYSISFSSHDSWCSQYYLTVKYISYAYNVDELLINLQRPEIFIDTLQGFRLLIILNNSANFL